MVPRLPRDVSGSDLIRLLERLGYEVVRRSSSHVRLVHPGPPVHRITVPDHDDLRVGTLSAILTENAAARTLERQFLVDALRT